MCKVFWGTGVIVALYQREVSLKYWKGGEVYHVIQADQIGSINLHCVYMQICIADIQGPDSI